MIWPAATLTISPGVSSAAGIVVQAPSRITRARGARFFFRAASAFAALLSCQKPTTAL